MESKGRVISAGIGMIVEAKNGKWYQRTPGSYYLPQFDFIPCSSLSFDNATQLLVCKVPHFILYSKSSRKAAEDLVKYDGKTDQLGREPRKAVGM